ncbi:MFS transporter [Flavobacterium sp. DGU11]|uniref:MFS transporter n=1 Tax=Flavobacterium arundinis TaxID=3139143 RepID=A0ABU9HX76_9FLAO
MKDTNYTSKKNLALILIIASLGYFVDIYDLVIFSIVRTQSLKDIGIAEDAIRESGMYIINMQMAGLLIGGFIWGTLGDKYGRLKVLFGSILLYSVANIANGFVHNVDAYAIIRLIAGIGLAGELGAGITLVSESMSKEKRGYGTMIVAGIGVLGAAAAFFVAEYFSWRNAYFTGGGMGLLLLLLRVGMLESGMFKKASHNEDVVKGNFFMLFGKRERGLRYIYCICISLPIWFVVGILITQAPELGKALGATETLSAGRGIMLCYIGTSLGEVIAGLIAQWSRSRRLSLAIFHIMSVIVVCLYLGSHGITPERFAVLAFLMGFSVGYWASFITIASEQFGTNLRATATTTAPNFVRGALIPVTFLFEFLVRQYDIISAGYIVMLLLTGIALFALWRLKESFGKDLDFVEG